MKFHTPASFIKYAPREWQTWVGIFGLLFYIDYYKDIHYFISSVLRSDQAVKTTWDLISDITIPGILSILVFIRDSKKKNDTQ